MSHISFKNIAAIVCGAVIGSSLRYLLSIIMKDSILPLSTMVVNVSGSFLFGIIMGWFITPHFPQWVKVGLLVGLCGSFTTMSTFAEESVFLLVQGEWLSFIMYVHFSVIGSLVGLLLGYLVGKEVRLWRARH